MNEFLIVFFKSILVGGMAGFSVGAGNSSGRFLGPLIMLAAINASIPIGIGSLLGALGFYTWKKPVAGGAILGAMIFGYIFPKVVG